MNTRTVGMEAHQSHRHFSNYRCDLIPYKTTCCLISHYDQKYPWNAARIAARTTRSIFTALTAFFGSITNRTSRFQRAPYAHKGLNQGNVVQISMHSDNSSLHGMVAWTRRKIPVQNHNHDITASIRYNDYMSDPFTALSIPALNHFSSPNLTASSVILLR